MLNSRNGRLISQVLVLALAVSVIPSIGVGQEPAAPVKKAPSRAKARGRLPAHFSRVVSSKQRNTIYQLQAQYAEKVAALKAQLDKLIETRDIEIDAVLTADQRRQVAQLRAEAKAAREARAQEKAKTEEVAEEEETKKAAGDGG